MTCNVSSGTFSLYSLIDSSLVLVAGVIDEIIFEAQTQQINALGEYKKDAAFINGLPNFTSMVNEHVKVTESRMIRVRSVDTDNLQEVEFYNFPPGSAVALRYQNTIL